MVPTIWKLDHSKSGQSCQNFKWFLTKWLPFVWISNGWAFRFQVKSWPFANQPVFDHLKSRLVLISDPNCNQLLWASYKLMTSSNITRLECRQAEPSLVHIGATVSRQLITTCPFIKLSNKCSSQFRVLFSLQQHITQYFSNSSYTLTIINIMLPYAVPMIQPKCKVPSSEHYNMSISKQEQNNFLART